MGFKPLEFLFWGLIVFPISQVFATETICGGTYDLLSFVNRPSIGDSPCVVPQHTSVLEMGYQYVSLWGDATQQNLPQPFYRIGLADRFELIMSLPNYIAQSIEPRRGITSTSLGVKHELYSNEQWVLSLEGITILPSGSSAFGSSNLGGIFNTILGYKLTSELSFSGMLSLATQSQSVLNGGPNYNSVNPNLVLSWERNKISIYAELYGESHTSFGQGSGVDMDAGISYLIKKNIVVDLEIAKRIQGKIGGYNQYLGTGIAIQFG